MNAEEQIEHIDQFVYRFTKLQDAMGGATLPLPTSSDAGPADMPLSGEVRRE